MLHRKLGRTNLSCSVVGLGTGRLTSFSSGLTQREAVRLVQCSAELGIDLIDTADIYGQGDSERVVGRAIRGRRDRIILASKVGYRFSGSGRLALALKPILKPVIRQMQATRRLAGALRERAATGNAIEQEFSPAYVADALHASLRRLGTDYLDILFLHDPPPAALESAALRQTLVDCRQAGKARLIGVSTTDAAVLHILIERPDEFGVVQTAVHPGRAAELKEVLPRLATNGTGVIANHVFANLRTAGSNTVPRDAKGGIVALDRHQAMIASALDRPAVAAALVGTTRIDHLRRNAAAAALVAARPQREFQS